MDDMKAGNKRDKWTIGITQFVNWLKSSKQNQLVEGTNITLTPLQDGTVRIDAEGGGGTVTDVQVDETSVVDEDGVAQIPAIPSELDDLDGVSISSPAIGEVLAYNPITQKWENGSGYDRFAPIIYSLEEREVGVFTDGKPLYQKTIEITSIASGAEKSLAHGISDIDVVVSVQGYAYNATDHKSFLTFIVPSDVTSNSTSINGRYVFAISNADRTNIVCAIGSGIVSQLTKLVFTIQYTKTTDVPGSGTWGTDGVPMVHYDGTERIIGTWFGETLYTKTYHYTGTLNSNAWVTLDSSRLPSNTPYFSVMNVCFISTELSSSAKFSAYKPSIPFDITVSTNEQLYFENMSNYKIYEFYITVQYTKAQ